MGKALRRPRTVVPKELGCAALLLAAMQPALADEGGVSFWLPGQFGSLAATPAEPGWSLATVYYHSTSDADADRQFQRGNRLTAGLDAEADLWMVSPTYTFAQPVMGGQAAVAVTAVFGRVGVDVAATLSGPKGTATASASDTLTAGGDLYVLGSIKWTKGAHNAMVYGMAGLPVGAYEPERLANIGAGHGAIDAGGGYTYFDEKNEFSAVLGLTYNFENSDTDYQNGLDLHLDLAASRFVTARTHIGVVGYAYNQITGDSGGGALLGDFKSRVAGVGPQLGHLFDVGERTWYVNFKACYEFAAEHRPGGWNAWAVLSIPLSVGPSE